MRTNKKTQKKKQTTHPTNDLGMGNTHLISTFIHMLNTVKLYHWKTTSYSTHKATDQLYSDLNTNIDQFVEILLGKPEFTLQKRYSLLNVRLIKLTQYKNNDDFRKQVEYYKSFLVNFSNIKSFNTPANTDLMNKRDELLAVFNQFLYLLTLKE